MLLSYNNIMPFFQSYLWIKRILHYIRKSFVKFEISLYVPDFLKSQEALTIVDVIRGNIKQFTILMNSSPGNLKYIIFRLVHG